MAPELENYWFERTGRRCGAKAIGWQGRLLTGLYALAVTVSATVLAERTITGFIVALVLATAIFLTITAAKTRGGLHW